MSGAADLRGRASTAIETATRVLRFAVLEDLKKDRKAGARHDVRYRGKLIAVRNGYDASDPRSLRGNLRFDSTLGRVDAWSRSGFHPAVFHHFIGELDQLQDRIDAITAELAGHSGTAETSPVDTLEAFIGLAYHQGVEAVARRVEGVGGRFDQAVLEGLMRRSVVSGMPFDVLQLGAPIATAKLVARLVEILDYTYIAIHGDMAFLFGAWVLAAQIERFTTEAPPLELWQPAPRPVLETTPTFPGPAAALPVPPGFPQNPIGQTPVLSLQNTLYRRWEDLAGGPEARRILAREKRRISIETWLAAKPRASPLEWPVPIHYLPTDDPVTRKRKSLGYNAIASVENRMWILKKLLAGTEKEVRWAGRPVLSHMVYRHNGVRQERIVKLNGGAYPRGGRKPPSVTHDTTYGLDLDLDVPNVQKRSKAEGMEELLELEEWLAVFDEPSFLEEFDLFGEVSQLWGKPDDFVAAVVFTQALMVTLPSRLLFGDPLVLIAALGGLREHLEPLEADQLSGLLADPPRHVFYEPKIHWNHWHVDWVPQQAIDDAEPIDEPWVYVAARPRRWDLKGESTAFSNRQRDLRRPIPIRYRNPVACGTEDEISALNDQLGTGVDLIGDALPEQSPFPLGAITDPYKIPEWRQKYFAP